jgi:hypothetical protein
MKQKKISSKKAKQLAGAIRCGRMKRKPPAREFRWN